MRLLQTTLAVCVLASLGAFAQERHPRAERAGAGQRS
jgi:hypothetical protein